MMFPDFTNDRSGRGARKNWTCTDSTCIRDARKEDRRGDSQQNRERLLCKIDLC
jgi:hypothetical protein